MVTSTAKKYIKKHSIFAILRRAVMITFGAILTGVALQIFLVPNQIIDGGIVGISIILSHLTGFSLGLFLFVLNIPFFFLGYKHIGKVFAYSSVLGITVLSLTTNFLQPIHVTATDDPLLTTVFGGITLGVGVGTVLRSGGSLDGTEILAIMFNKSIPFSVGETIMFFNIFILGSAGFVFSWDSAMYSLITYFIAYKMIDIVIQGLDESKSVWIISQNYEEVGNAIIHELGRSVTYLEGQGGFTGTEMKVIFCVVTRLEEAKLKMLITDVDPDAFLAVANISEVRGGRFKQRELH